ncbi:MAG: M14 metallopeptidase family protein, partial [Vicinamibacteria bacterium]
MQIGFRARALCLGLMLAVCAPGARAQIRPATAKVPEPKDVFGFKPGEDYKVFSWAEDVDYFKKLDASSDRIVVEEIGKTTLGKPMLLAFISSEVNLKNRLRYKEIAKQLALTKGVDEAKARVLAQEGKAIVWIDGGMHSTEIANSHSMPELAHWLVTDESAEARRIRDNVILLLMPHLNPDGIDIVGNWYKKNLGTPFETTTQPEVYQHYIGHDNNRDWYMFTQIETRAVAKQLYEEWFPEIVYNHHQSSPFPGRIFGPPMKNPVNPNLDPLLVSTVNQIGEHMRKRFDFENKPGYNSGIVYDMWWNGSMRGVPDFHNMAGYLTETALYRMATPHCYAPEEIPENFGERASFLPAKTPSTDYTNPWLGGCWHLKDAIDYMITASKATLDIA